MNNIISGQKGFLTTLFFLILFFGTVATPLKAQATNMIVFKVKGVNLTPGQSINAKQNLVLTEQQSISMIAPNGQIINISGPYNGPAAAKVEQTNSGLANALSVLVSSRGSNNESLGASRDATSSIAAAQKYGFVPTPWLIDVTRSGDHCLWKSKRPVLWRPDVSQSSRIKMNIGENIWQASAKWTARYSKMVAPPNMPLLDGEIYRFELDNNKTIAKLHIIPAEVSSGPVLAAWMNEKGCKSQALSLLNTM
ncbi:MAG: hypothetical protein HQL71_10160 [Magnetococcales bacterium]|nr:hypothetical protein [Magnetococcales bacterium]